MNGRHLSHCYTAFLGVLLGHNVKHIHAITINNSVFKFCISPDVRIGGFHTADGAANRG